MENEYNDSMELYNIGKRLEQDIEKYSEIIRGSEKGDSEESKDKVIAISKEKAEEKIVSLKEKREKLKEYIYAQAKEKSGLDYSKKENNPELIKKEYNEKLEQLKKRKQELKLDKIRIRKLNEEKKSQIEAQYNIAYEKYKTMLDMGKISQELFDSRVENMKSAKQKDAVALDKSLEKVDVESEKVSGEIKDLQDKISEVEKKEIIYNEYGDVYYRLFGEVLTDRNKMEKSDITNSSKDKTMKEDENGLKMPGKDDLEDKTKSVASNGFKAPGKDDLEDGTKVEQTNGFKAPGKNDLEDETNKENNEENNKQEKEETKITIENKAMFNELYKKMKKGNISDNELNALAETLEKPDNYDKFGITTGIVFNKAKKILKFQGARTAKNIDKFINECRVFNNDIKFDSSLEKDNVLSHKVLNSWKDIDQKLVYTDAKFSVENYIEKIEQYKESGKLLSKEQDDILKKAVSIKNSLESYRKAVNVNDDVTLERKNKFYDSILGNFIKDNSSKALPETREVKNKDGYVVIDNRFDLSSMVNNEPTAQELSEDKSAKSKEINDGLTK